MKPKFLFLSMILILFMACNKNEVQNEVQDNSAKLRSVYRSYDTIDYFYSNGRISKKVAGSNSDQTTIQYYYHEGIIDSLVLDDVYIDPKAFLYFHNADTLVRIESRGQDHTIIKFLYDSDHKLRAQSCAYFYYGGHGTWFFIDFLFTFQFSGGNIVKCIEGQREDPSHPYGTTDTIIYNYDDKHNPFSIDIDPDVFFFPFSSHDFRYRNKNNVTSEVHSSYCAYNKKIEYSYTYNSENYPDSTEIKMTNQYGNVLYRKERYNYMKK